MAPGAFDQDALRCLKKSAVLYIVNDEEEGQHPQGAGIELHYFHKGRWVDRAETA